MIAAFMALCPACGRISISLPADEHVRPGPGAFRCVARDIHQSMGTHIAICGTCGVIKVAEHDRRRYRKLTRAEGEFIRNHPMHAAICEGMEDYHHYRGEWG